MTPPATNSQVWAQPITETDPTRSDALDPDGTSLAWEKLTPGAAPAWWTVETPAGAEPTTRVSVRDGDTIRVTLRGATGPVRLFLFDSRLLLPLPRAYLAFSARHPACVLS